MNRSSAKSLLRLIRIKENLSSVDADEGRHSATLTSQTISPSLTFTDVELRVVVKSLLKLR
jgi:hypothetical protein